MADLGKLRVNFAHFHRWVARSAVSGFETSSIPYWWGWKSSAPDHLRVEGGTLGDADRLDVVSQSIRLEMVNHA
jgi:hypothetical protein